MSLGMPQALYEKAVLTKHQTGIRRVSWTIDDLNKSSKARRMREIIADAEEEDRKILVFSFYRDTLKAISSFLGGRCTQIINGSVPVERRQEIIDEFGKMPAGSVLLAQIGAGGTGLNIQAASVVIICEPQLKPSTENQAIARAHRMGQSRTVLVYRLLAAETIDERIEDMLKEKQAIFDAFADKSAAADATNQEESQIDDKTLGKLILDEINRINAKNGNVRTMTVDSMQAVDKVSPAVESNPADTVTPELCYEEATPDIYAPAESPLAEDSPSEKENRQTVVKSVSSVNTFPSVDAFIAFLVSQGIEYKDNRPKNGCLWIQADALPAADTFKIDGSSLMYSKASKALKGAAGWYIS